MLARRAWLTIAVILVVYCIFRIWALPVDPLHAYGMGHDSAYLTIVARNLLAGKGFVLDALWLVFLMPEHLPMPYHNANPLYPVLMAFTSGLSGMDLFRSGFLLSAFSGAVLILALTALLSFFSIRPLHALLIAVCAALFPPVWVLSWQNMADGWWLALMIAAIAALVRSEKMIMSLAAGALFGLAWLTRSAASVALPAVAVWLLMTFRLRGAAARLLLIASSAVLVCSPWLMHNKHVWNSPFRSDNGLILASHLESRNYGDRVVRVWHLPEAPPSALHAIETAPKLVMIRTAMGGIRAVREFIRAAGGPGGITASNIFRLSVLFGLTLLAFLQSPGILRSAGFISLAVYSIMMIGVIAPQSEYTESRYFALIYTLFAVWLAAQLWNRFTSRAPVRSGGAAWAEVTMAVIFMGLCIAPADYELARYMRSVDTEALAYMDAAQVLNRTVAHGSPVVVGNHPYFYTMVTGSQALSIPQSDDPYLLRYMAKYHARYIFLSEEERNFWKPGWESGNGAANGIHARPKIGPYYVYEVGNLQQGSPDVMTKPGSAESKKSEGESGT